MNKFEEFNIKSIPCSKNSEADMLDNVESNLSANDDLTHDKFSIEFIYMPSTRDNITSWRIFDDDQQIIYFIHSKDTFRGSIINDEQHESLL